MKNYWIQMYHMYFNISKIVEKNLISQLIMTIFEVYKHLREPLHTKMESL